MNNKIFVLLIFFLLVGVYLSKVYSQEEYYVISETELQYLDTDGIKVLVPVQLRTHKRKLNIEREENGGCFNLNGNGNIYKSEEWEIVTNPNTDKEYSVRVDDWGGFVSNTFHNGKLYVDEFECKNDVDRLFLYFFYYGTCSYEAMTMFYYDRELNKLISIGFEMKNGEIEQDVLVSLKILPKLERAVNQDYTDCPRGMLYDKGWDNYNEEWITVIRKYNSGGKVFNLYNTFVTPYNK